MAAKTVRPFSPESHCLSAGARAALTKGQTDGADNAEPTTTTVSSRPSETTAEPKEFSLAGTANGWGCGR